MGKITSSLFMKMNYVTIEVDSNLLNINVNLYRSGIKSKKKVWKSLALQLNGPIYSTTQQSTNHLDHSSKIPSFY